MATGTCTLRYLNIGTFPTGNFVRWEVSKQELFKLRYLNIGIFPTGNFVAGKQELFILGYLKIFRLRLQQNFAHSEI